MKLRTIEELHDKEIGHRKFAKVCDLVLEEGYQITEIKEYNEQFKFKINKYDFVYRKEWKASSEEFVRYLLNVLALQEQLENLRK